MKHGKVVMKNPVRFMRFGGEIYLILLGTLSVLLVASVPASAELGGGVSSVYRDLEHTNGTIQVRNKQQYIIFEINGPTGTTVREFVSSDGTVFAIAWEGRFIPEMNQFLGTYFDQYSAAVKAQTRKYVGRRPLEIHLPNLVFESNGHMGWYYGRAYIPQTVPKQARVEDIR
jgi:hypothetical protein